MSRLADQLESAEARLQTAETRARSALDLYESAKAELATAIEEYTRQQIHLDRARRRVSELKLALARQ